ncbi:MAG: hypothetical protein P1V97_29650 [Planctomycetota bacterium]|nr:hypothetical protein [Planctomycetota bacterium]
MNRMITFGAAILAALSLNSVANAQEVTFKRAIPGVGDAREVSEDMTLTNKISVTMNGKVVQEVDQKQHASKTEKITILSRAGKKIAKIKVDYIKGEATEDAGRGPKTSKSGLVGKSFILEDKGDKVLVVEENGKKPAEDDERRVTQSHSKFLGEFRNKFADVLPDRAIKIGETITVEKEKANKFFRDDAKKVTLTVELFTLKLTGTKKINGETVGVFEMHLKFVDNFAKGMKLATDLSGTALVGVNTCFSHLIDIKGPMEMSGKNQGMVMSGKGEMHMKNKVTYSKAGAASKPTSGGK